MSADSFGTGPTRLGGRDADQWPIANALPHIIWTCDAQGRVEWVNDRFTSLTGITREEYLGGEDILAVVHPDDRHRLEQGFAGALATSSPCELEYRLRTQDGAYRFHFLRVVPIRDDSGVITRWVGAAYDIHDRHEATEALRASEQRFQTVFQVNPQPAAITRFSDGKFLIVNDAFLKMAGYARDEIVGKTTVELGFITARGRAATLDGLKGAETTEFEADLVTRDGRPITLAVVSARIDFGGEACLVKCGDRRDATPGDRRGPA